MSLVWQDPPESHTGRPGAPRRWVEEAAELRAHPKRWALIKTMPEGSNARSFATQARRGDKAAFLPIGAWEFRVTGGDVYARYLGEDAS